MVVLGAACVSLAALHTDNSPTSSVKGHPGSVTGQQLLAAHYPAGAFNPLDLLTPPREAAAAAAAARATPGVASVAPRSPVGAYTSYSVTLSADPYGSHAGTVIQDLRDRLARDAPGSLVGGGPAISYDTTQAARHDSLLLIPFVLLVILVIIALLLQAIVAALVLVLTTALSFAASFGLANLVFHNGLGYPGIESQIPLYIFIFLVALGVDYNIFLSARIREEVNVRVDQGTLTALAAHRRHHRSPRPPRARRDVRHAGTLPLVVLDRDSASTWRQVACEMHAHRPVGPGHALNLDLGRRMLVAEPPGQAAAPEVSAVPSGPVASLLLAASPPRAVVRPSHSSGRTGAWPALARASRLAAAYRPGHRLPASLDVPDGPGGLLCSARALGQIPRSSCSARPRATSCAAGARGVCSA